MAKICPITKEKVLYLDCLDCEVKQQCRDLSLSNHSDDKKQDVKK